MDKLYHKNVRRALLANLIQHPLLMVANQMSMGNLRPVQSMSESWGRSLV